VPCGLDGSRAGAMTINMTINFLCREYDAPLFLYIRTSSPEGRVVLPPSLGRGIGPGASHS
jgi:hypothetical protein